MKSLPNVLRLVVLDPPRGFEPRLEAKGGAQIGTADPDGHVVFETLYVCKEEVAGPAFRQEGERRWSVYVGWYDAGGRRRGRLKVPLDAIPELINDCEVQVAGRGADGEPARGIAEVVSARNVEDYLFDPGESK